MCFNCGCEMPEDNMGDPRNITKKTFKDAAEAMNQTVEEAKKETLKLLKKQLGEN